MMRLRSNKGYIRDVHDNEMGNDGDTKIGSDRQRTITKCRHNTSKRTGMKRAS